MTLTQYLSTVSRSSTLSVRRMLSSRTSHKTAIHHWIGPGRMWQCILRFGTACPRGVSSGVLCDYGGTPTSSSSCQASARFSANSRNRTLDLWTSRMPNFCPRVGRSCNGHVQRPHLFSLSSPVKTISRALQPVFNMESNVLHPTCASSTIARHSHITFHAVANVVPQLSSTGLDFQRAHPLASSTTFKAHGVQSVDARIRNPTQDASVHVYRSNGIRSTRENGTLFNNNKTVADVHHHEMTHATKTLQHLFF